MAKIEKTASGKYTCRIYLGQTADGRKRYRKFTHSDKRILQSIVSEFELAHREYRDSDTFGACLERYISQRDGIVSPSTIRGYKSIQRVMKDKYGAFCGMSLSSIGRTDIQKVISDLHRKEKSGKYIKNIHGIISAVLIENDYISPKVTMPKAAPKKVYEPSKEDIMATLKAARGTDLEIPILLGIHGLRRSEICALKYPDDFIGDVVHVHSALVYGDKQTVHEKETKTDMSDRMVPISAECLELIQKQGYVTNKTMAAITLAFDKLLTRNDIPKYRFHDLRHFFASYLHESGFSDAQIMKLGGWKTDSVMKNFYRYALPDETIKTKVGNTMQSLISGQKSED